MAILIEDLCTFMLNISLNSSFNDMFQAEVVEKIKTSILW